ncbi:hypothetical protein [Sinomicrobium oceani]|uniref:hypothetical protein n=1 Tax=Sinomicrobium oceani TaxID=1150368 RepID=UPI00227CBAC1|nr:hypothetical protein [Sinomicrobium oceani]
MIKPNILFKIFMLAGKRTYGDMQVIHLNFIGIKRFFGGGVKNRDIYFTVAIIVKNKELTRVPVPGKTPWGNRIARKGETTGYSFSVISRLARS